MLLVFHDLCLWYDLVIVVLLRAVIENAWTDRLLYFE